MFAILIKSLPYIILVVDENKHLFSYLMHHTSDKLAVCFLLYQLIASHLKSRALSSSSVTYGKLLILMLNDRATKYIEYGILFSLLYLVFYLFVNHVYMIAWNKTV